MIPKKLAERRDELAFDCGAKYWPPNPHQDGPTAQGNIAQDSYKEGFNATCAEVLPLLDKALAQLKLECCCTGELDYERKTIYCDPCETAIKIKSALEGGE